LGLGKYRNPAFRKSKTWEINKPITLGIGASDGHERLSGIAYKLPKWKERDNKMNKYLDAQIYMSKKFSKTYLK